MCKILLLEDDVSLIDGLVYSLERNGFSLDVVRTVKDAENYLSKHEYDLLLLDVTLPDGTVTCLLSSLRRQMRRSM